jgi:hypothetical protein
VGVMSTARNVLWEALEFAMIHRLLLLSVVLLICCSTQAHGVAAVTRHYNESNGEALLDCLGDQDAEVRALAAGILGETSETKATHALAPRAVPALAGLLKDPDPRVRHQAAKALGSFRDARAIPALEEAMRGPDLEDVPGLAALALGSIGEASTVAIPTLLEVFPVKPEEKRKITTTSQPQQVIGSIDLGGAVMTAPMVRTQYVVNTVPVPAAARALEAITGISLDEGGMSRESWRNRLQLPSARHPPDQPMRESPR